MEMIRDDNDNAHDMGYDDDDLQGKQTINIHLSIHDRLTVILINTDHITSYHPVESMQGDVLERQRQDDLMHCCGEGEHRQTGQDLRHPHTDQRMVWIR